MPVEASPLAGSVLFDGRLERGRKAKHESFQGLLSWFLHLWSFFLTNGAAVINLAVFASIGVADAVAFAIRGVLVFVFAVTGFNHARNHNRFANFRQPKNGIIVISHFCQTEFAAPGTTD